MKYYIVIPVFNEQEHILKTLSSIALQSHLPQKVVVVDDNSTDNTAALVADFIKDYPYIQLVEQTSAPNHQPGSKVINAFLKGLAHLDTHYDFIVKLDGDLILPTDYFEVIANIFRQNSTVGIAGGRAYIQKGADWVLESLTDDDHVRGAFKSYRKACFVAIGTLQPQMGWDTVDELLARYYNWEVKVDKTLQVKHLKPTGASYHKSSGYKQGEAFYKLGYGFFITSIAAAKLAFNKRNWSLFVHYMVGFCKAQRNKTPKLVTPPQEKFVRRYRWQKIKQKIFG